MMKRSWIIASLILFGVVTKTVADEVYTWVDRQGTVNFSDQPTPGSRQLSLQTPQSYGGSANTAPATAPVTPGGTEAAAPPAATEPAGYTAVKITSPRPEETIWDNNGQLAVAVVVEPALKDGDKLQLLIDGQQAGSPQAATTLQVTGLPRGAHQLQVQVLANNGAVLVTSDSVVFYMHHAIQRKLAF